MKKILIRCDSSDIIGIGHVMRTLNYCDYLIADEFIFVCRSFKMNAIHKIIEKNNRNKVLPLKYYIEPELNNHSTWIGVSYQNEIKEFVDLVKNEHYEEIIIDHYGIDYLLEEKIKPHCKKITIISDLLNVKHFCDEYINYNSDNETLLKSININPYTNIKCGIKNIIINKKFMSSKKINNKNAIETICIMMGGSDPNNYTLTCLKLIKDILIQNSIKLYIVIGSSNANYSSIQKYVDTECIKQCNVFHDLSYDELIELYLKTDLCIGSLSITAFERMHMNVRQICLQIVNNQTNCYNLFDVCEVNELYTIVNKYIQNNHNLLQLI